MKTYIATIHIGFKNRTNGIEHSIQEVELILQRHCDSVGDCVSITPTKFIYTNGNENGCRIEWIQYPRFPRDEQDIKNRAVSIARLLATLIDQCRVTITTNDETIMINENN